MRIEVLRTEIDKLKKEHSQALITKNMRLARQILTKIDQKTRELKHAEAEETIQKAKDNGTLAKISRLLSASQIAINQANNLIEEASDLYKKNGLMIDEIAALYHQYAKAADRYFHEFGKMVEDEKKMDMFKDMDEFDHIFRVWAGLKQPPKPVSLMIGCKDAARAANERSKMCAKCQMTYNPETIMCQSCNKSFWEGFEKGARWLENKRIERLTSKEDNNTKND